MIAYIKKVAMNILGAILRKILPRLGGFGGN